MALHEEMERQGNWLFKFRGTLPIIILLVGIWVYIQSEITPNTALIKTLPYEYYYEGLCLLVSIFGLLIRIYTVGHTPRNTSGRNIDGQLAEVLNTTGIYSLVRNPLYLGNFFMWLGVGMLSGNLWFIVAFILFYWIYYERIIFAEEQFLTAKFGSQYTTWAAKTPCFIPKLSGFTKPSETFSWKKVVKKEKNGLVALLLIFSVLDYSVQYLRHEPAKYPTFAIVTAAFCVLYFIIKYLKHKTTVLDEEGR